MPSREVRFGSARPFLRLLFKNGKRARLRDWCSRPTERQGAGFTVRMVVTVSPIEAEISARHHRAQVITGWIDRVVGSGAKCMIGACHR
jgi:hypothetical protein